MTPPEPEHIHVSRNLNAASNGQGQANPEVLEVAPEDRQRLHRAIAEGRPVVFDKHGEIVRLVE